MNGQFNTLRTFAPIALVDMALYYHGCIKRAKYSADTESCCQFVLVATYSIATTTNGGPCSHGPTGEAS